MDIFGIVALVSQLVGILVFAVSMIRWLKSPDAKRLFASLV